MGKTCIIDITDKTQYVVPPTVNHTLEEFMGRALVQLQHFEILNSTLSVLRTFSFSQAQTSHSEHTFSSLKLCCFFLTISSHVQFLAFRAQESGNLSHHPC